MAIEQGNGRRAVAPVGYPMEFRYSAGMRGLCLFVALLLFGLSAGLLYVAMGGYRSLPAWAAGLLLLNTLLTSWLAWTMLNSSFSVLVVQADALELRRPFGVRRLARAQIAGWRGRMAKGRSIGWALVPKSGAPLNIDGNMVDGRFVPWLADLPDLNAQERAGILHAIERDSALGATVADRRAALGRAKRLVGACMAVAVACFLWSMFHPRPYPLLLIVLGLLPWLGWVVVWTSRGLVRFDVTASDPRPSMALVIWLPCAALLLRALMSVDLMGPLLPVLVAGALVGLPLGWSMIAGAGALPSPLGQKLFLYPFLLCISTAYGASGLALVDAVFDRGEAQVVPVRIVDKRISRGRSVTHLIRVAPWGSLTQPREFKITSAWYQELEPGGLVCVHQHPGLFGWPWLQLSECPQGAAPAATE